MDSEIFYIMATGPSINDITKEEWQYLKEQNTMGISWFAKKNFPTKYYYFHEGNQRKTLHQIMTNPGWKRTCFITTKGHKRPAGAKKVYFIKHTPFKEAFRGKTWLNTEEEPPEPFEKVWAKSFEEPLFGFRGTLMAALNAAYILGGREFILCGVDLNDNSHFYKEEEFSSFNKSLEDKGVKLKKHSSAVTFDGVRTAVDCLQWLSNYINLYVASKKSLLYKKRILPFREIICK